MSREKVQELMQRLHEAQRHATAQIVETVGYENLSDRTPDGFTVLEALRGWIWHFWSHHRDLVRARGEQDTSPEGDPP